MSDLLQQGCVLAVAGSDSCAGAGVQADLKACAALGVYAATAITAITAQNSLGVEEVELVSSAMVGQQMRSVLSDLPVAVVKIGMLAAAEIVEAVATVLDAYPTLQVVLDPVMMSSSGRSLLDQAGRQVMLERLLPKTTVFTPNVLEAAALLGCSLDRVKREPEWAVRQLAGLGAVAVLLKGGHCHGESSEDLLWFDGKLRVYTAPRLSVRNSHGTGCTLASAIAAGLSKGKSVSESVAVAKRYLTESLATADRFDRGAGSGSLNHFGW